MTILKRRRIFVSLVGTFGITVFLGLLPGLRNVLWASLFLAIILGGFTAYLIQEKDRTPVHNRLTQPSAGDRSRAEDIPTVLRLAYTPPVPTRVGGRTVHRIVDESLEDDGLNELGWLKAGGRY